MIVLGAAAGGSVDVRLSGDEVVMLNNALNEVCNGVDDLADDGEFQTRLGFDRDEVRRLLEEINAVRPISN